MQPLQFPRPPSTRYSRPAVAGAVVALSELQQKPQQYTSLYCKPMDRKGDVVRSAGVPLLYPCRYAREKLSVRESDRRCPPLAFCPKRISVGRAHHHRKGMQSIRRLRTKLTFRRNLCILTNGESCTRPISTTPGSMEVGEYRQMRGTCLIVRRPEVVPVAGLL